MPDLTREMVLDHLAALEQAASDEDYTMDWDEARALTTWLDSSDDSLRSDLQAARKALTLRDAVVEAADSLKQQLFAVHNDPRYQMVWLMAQNAHGPYEGKTYTAELDALDAALAELHAGEGEG